MKFIMRLFVKDEVCSCGHPRNYHSRNGCLEHGCGCPRKYMDW